MKKIVSAAASIAMVCIVLFSMVCLSASADATVSLLPASADQFVCVDGGNGSVTVTAAEKGGYCFTANAGWPSAYFTELDASTQTSWVETNINSGSTLNYDFEVVSGAANVIVYFAGQNPNDMAAKGSFVCINGLVDSSYVNPDTGDAVMDLPAGVYQGTVDVADLGYAETLLGENGEMLITGIKVFAVGGEVIVNDLSVTVNDGDTTTSTTAEEDVTTTTAGDDTTSTTGSGDTTTTTTAVVNNGVSNTATLDGLEITITADKAEYAAGEPIEVTLTVRNSTDTAMNNVVLEHVIPQGYALKEGTQNKNAVAALGAGETVTLTAIYVEGDDTTTTTAPVKGGSPNTAEQSTTWIAVLAAAIAVAVTVAAIKTKKAKQLLSLALCLALFASVTAIVPDVASAQEATASGSTSLNVSVKTADGDVTLTGTVSYGQPIDSSQYANLAAWTFASVHNDYENAEPLDAAIKAYYDTNGDVLVIVYVQYKIIDTHSTTSLYIIDSEGQMQEIEDPETAFDQMIDRASGADKLGLLMKKGEYLKHKKAMLEAAIDYMVNGVPMPMEAGYYVDETGFGPYSK